jgi:hypothetical protein
MGWSGGSYSKGNAGTGGWAGDASSGIGIEAGRHDTQDNDFATGINQCINKDGSNSMTGPFNAGGQNVINAAKVAIGTTTPTELLTVVAPASGSGGISLRGNGTSAANEFFIASSTDGATTYVYNRANGDMIFGTNNADRVRIDSSGRIGVGAASFTSAQFYASATPSFRVAGRFYQAASGDVGTPAINLDKYDNNSTTSQVFLQATINQQSAGCGQINANGASQLAFGTYSDARLKENITPLPNQLASILALKPCEFDYKDGTGHQIGFIAQEVQAIYPDLVGQRQDGMLTVSGLGKLEARLIKAIQELSAKVEALEDQLSATTVLP